MCFHYVNQDTQPDLFISFPTKQKEIRWQEKYTSFKQPIQLV